ncbi:MAG TPA: hypothetical protein VN914_04365 [Polyangia bacterium]|nr:hypothetical protein [Polyangia bacterium]
MTAAPAPEATPAVSTEVTNKVQHKKMDPPAIWFRLDNQIKSKDPANAKKLNGFVMGSEVDVLFSGQVHEYVAWQADFVGTFGNAVKAGDEANQKITGQAAILDLIGKFQLHDAFNVWVGRMLVPSDRSNFSGPWFMSAWNYPGFYNAAALGGAPLGPRQGPFGRNDGATVWGQFLGGHVKYYAGAFDLHSLGEKALYSGRLNFTLLNPEPGYYHSSTYYGGKDIVALGLMGQYKKDGSALPMPALPDPTFVAMSENYSMIGADLLAEKKLGDAGTATVEGAFYKFNGKYEPAKNGFYALASYLIPVEVGIGRFQPLVRLQQAKSQTDKTWRLIDAAVSYVVDEYAMRIALNYQNADIEGVKANAVTVGIQIQK